MGAIGTAVDEIAILPVFRIRSVPSGVVELHRHWDDVPRILRDVAVVDEALGNDVFSGP
jgi:hypothetical protein